MKTRLFLIAAIYLSASASPLLAQWTGVTSGIYYSGGNVGIGTTSPVWPLHVSGSGLETVRITGANNGAGAPGPLLQLEDTGTGGTKWNIENGRYNAALDFFSNALDAPAMTLLSNGNVGIGTTDPVNTISVNGTVQAKEVLVNTGWSDYVFAPGYRLLALKDTAAYIQENGHLPGIPSEAEVKEKGVPVGEMESKLLAKVEELTLHMIQADERNDRLERRNQELQDKLARLESRLITGQVK